MTDDKSRPRQLGRGLEALFGDDRPGPPAPNAGSPSTHTVPIGQLIPNPAQPRRHYDDDALRDLTNSVREKGVLQPLIVRPVDGEPDRYEIVAGERRWRAAQRARIHEVPVVVHHLTDEETLAVALIENIQRDDLTPIEEAEAYQRLAQDFDHTQEKVAALVGKSRSHVANTVRLLALPAAVRDLLRDKSLSAGHARAILNAPDPTSLAQRIVAYGLSVREAERLAQAAKEPVSTRPHITRRKPQKDADTLALEHELGNILGVRVEIDFDGKGGQLKLKYGSLEQLDDIVDRLSGRSPAVSSPAATAPVHTGFEENIPGPGETAGPAEDNISPFPIKS